MFENNFVINWEVARKNMQAHEKKMEKLRRKYIKQLCKDINRESKNGNKMIFTKTLKENFMTYEFMMELKEYFEKLGFTVAEKGFSSFGLLPFLEIRWDD
jgi:hypothetical protein